MNVFFLRGSTAPVCQSLLCDVRRTDTPESVGLLWTSDQPDADTSDNTQHSQQTDIHALGCIRTHNRKRRAAADPRLRPHGYREWPHHNLVLLVTYFQ